MLHLLFFYVLKADIIIHSPISDILHSAGSMEWNVPTGLGMRDEVRDQTWIGARISTSGDHFFLIRVSFVAHSSPLLFFPLGRVGVLIISVAAILIDIKHSEKGNLPGQRARLLLTSEVEGRAWVILWGQTWPQRGWKGVDLVLDLCEGLLTWSMQLVTGDQEG